MIQSSFRRRFRALLLGALLALSARAASAVDLTGSWCDENNTPYTFRQAGTEFCWRMNGLPVVENVFCGSVIGRFVVGAWLDLPTGQIVGGGRLVLAIESDNRLTKAYQEGDYGGSVWTRLHSGSCFEGHPPAISVPPPEGSPGSGSRASAPPPPPPSGTAGSRTYPPPPPPPTGGGTSAPRTSAPPPPPPTYPTTPRTNAPAPSAPRSNAPPPTAPRSNAPAPPAYSPPAPSAPAMPTHGGAVSLPPRPGSWRLVSLEQRGSMDDRPQTPGDGGMRFDVRRFDATGGEVLATVAMAVPVICGQAETETIRVKWSFPTDMRYLTPGQEFPVDMEVSPYSQSRSCPGAVFGRSEAVVMRSEGSIEDIPQAERPGYWPIFTHPYVKDPTGVRLNFYVGGAPSGRALLRVHDERPPINGPRRSSFSIRFWSNGCCGTPQPAANTWAFHYFYEY